MHKNSSSSIKELGEYVGVEVLNTEATVFSIEQIYISVALIIVNI